MKMSNQVKAHTRKDGTRVKAHTRKGKKGNRRKSSSQDKGEFYDHPYPRVGGPEWKAKKKAKARKVVKKRPSGTDGRSRERRAQTRRRSTKDKSANELRQMVSKQEGIVANYAAMKKRHGKLSKFGEKEYQKAKDVLAKIKKAKARSRAALKESMESSRRDVLAVAMRDGRKGPEFLEAYRLYEKDRDAYDALCMKESRQVKAHTRKDGTRVKAHTRKGQPKKVDPEKRQGPKSRKGLTIKGKHGDITVGKGLHQAKKKSARDDLARQQGDKPWTVRTLKKEIKDRKETIDWYNSKARNARRKGNENQLAYALGGRDYAQKKLDKATKLLKAMDKKK